MSWWDIIIVLLIAFALFRGYQRGLSMRLTGWVGGVLAFLLLWYRFEDLSAWVYKFYDGKHKVAAWIHDYLVNRNAGQDFFADSQVMEIIEGLPLPPAVAFNITDQLAEAGAGLQSGIYEHIANAIAQPVWNIILFLIAWVFLQVFLGFVGQMLNILLIRVRVLSIIDKYLGALASAVFSLALIALLSVVLMTLLSETTTLGSAVHNSYFAPALRTAMGLFFRSGDVV